jgi:hypothetical protein
MHDKLIHGKCCETGQHSGHKHELPTSLLIHRNIPIVDQSVYDFTTLTGIFNFEANSRVIHAGGRHEEKLTAPTL